jgi:hypothetical protein
VEEAAPREAVHALARPARGFLTIDQAAESLGVSVPTVRGFVERGALAAGPGEGCEFVSAEGVEHLVRLRESLRELDREGNPTPEEIRELYSRPRRPARRDVAAS